MSSYSKPAVKMQHNLEIVRQYRAAGYNLIPLRCDGTKAPKIKAWNKYSIEQFPDSSFEFWFGSPNRLSGIGLLCGQTSGGLEVLDFDALPCFLPWATAVCREFPSLLRSLAIVASPDNGRHVYWRSPIVEPSQVLAKDEAGKMLIETMAQGSHIVAVGSPLSTHPTRRPYRLAKGSLLNVPIIEADQRNVMLDLARKFNRYTRAASESRMPAIEASESREWLREFGIEQEICDRPGDRFNREATWEQVLNGWTKVRESNGIAYWQKPGSAGLEHHATTGHHGRDTLYVFSTAIDGLEAGQAYSKFAAFASLYHRGDFSAAASQLAIKYSSSQRGQQ